MEVVGEVGLVEFLRCSIAASRATGYAGLICTIARHGDNTTLLEDIEAHWRGLHDVTGSVLGVIVPSSKPAELRVGNYGRVWLAHGATIGTSDDEAWVTAFKRAHPKVDRPILPPGSRARSDPPDTGVTGQHITQWASMMRDFFHLPESLVPCVVVVSLWDGHIYVVPVGQTFRLYDFCKLLIESLTIAGDLTELHRRQPIVQHELELIDRQFGPDARRRRRAADNVKAQWLQQTERLGEGLRSLPANTITNDCVTEVVEGLRAAPDDPGALPATLARLDSALAALDAAQDPSIENRLRLERARKRLVQGIPDLEAARARAETAERHRDEATQTLHQEMAEIERNLEAHRQSGALGLAVRAAAATRGVRSVEANLDRSLPGDVFIVGASKGSAAVQEKHAD